MPGLVLPVAAVVTGFALVAGPILLLAAIWAAVSAVRILFPEQPLPLDGPSRRERALRRGHATPVRLRDILEDDARRRASQATVRPRPLTPTATEAGPRPADASRSHADDLWLRRN